MSVHIMSEVRAAGSSPGAPRLGSFRFLGSKKGKSLFVQRETGSQMTATTTSNPLVTR